jgi:hypothetical protein
MELPYEPMKRTTTALKQEKEEAFMMVAFTGHTTGRNENKYYCKCTIEKMTDFQLCYLIIIETRI